jgi:hypothetical protein
MFRKVPFAWRNIYVPEGSFAWRNSLECRAWRNICLEERTSLRVLPEGSFAWRNV